MCQQAQRSHTEIAQSILAPTETKSISPVHLKAVKTTHLIRTIQVVHHFSVGIVWEADLCRGGPTGQARKFINHSIRLRRIQVLSKMIDSVVVLQHGLLGRQCYLTDAHIPDRLQTGVVDKLQEQQLDVGVHDEGDAGIGCA